ncbi:MAG: hypothetical protein ACRD6X_03455 [Pyrinomonadaceae bacterium]
MPKPKKRPSKSAKAAMKAVSESKLLGAKNELEKQTDREFKSSVVTPRTNKTALKPRPDKKRG